MNCRGIPFISKDREKRMGAIGKYLSGGHHDIVCLQEVWSTYDYIHLKNAAKDALPYSHYFYRYVFFASYLQVS